MARWLGGSPVNETGEPPSHSSDTLFKSGPVFCSLAQMDIEFTLTNFGFWS